MLKYYYDYYRKLNLAEHFGFDFPLPEIIAGLAIGLCVALIVYDYYRAGMFSLAKALLRHGATGEEKAMTLSQLGLEGKRSARSLLRSSTSRLSAIIGRAGGSTLPGYDEYVDMTKEEKKNAGKRDIDSESFYIKPDKLDAVRKIYDAGGASPLKTVFMIILILAVFGLIIFCLPEILSFISGKGA